MSADMLVMIVTVAAALALAIRGFRARGADFHRTATMAIVWVAIIAALGFIMQR